MDKQKEECRAECRALWHPRLKIAKGLATMSAAQLVEETPRLTGPCTLRNLELMIHLLHWLPQLETAALQLWLAEQLDTLVRGSLRSRMSCARGGVIPAIIHVLARSTTIGGRAVGEERPLLRRLW